LIIAFKVIIVIIVIASVDALGGHQLDTKRGDINRGIHSSPRSLAFLRSMNYNVVLPCPTVLWDFTLWQQKKSQQKPTHNNEDYYPILVHLLVPSFCFCN